MTWQQIEVVYGPQETRVYLYDIYRSPVSTRGVQGQAIMRVRSNATEFRYPLQYVPVERGQDYLVAHVDLTRVQNGDMDVHYELAGLPNREVHTASFSQVFSMMQPVYASAGQLLPAHRALSSNDDRTGVVRQASVSVPDAIATDRPAVIRQPPNKKSCH